MKFPEFKWAPQPDPEKKDHIEMKLYEIIKDLRDDKWPCHPNDIIISLGISGPLETTLKGIAKCKNCDKRLMIFEGDDLASNLNLTTYK